MLCNQLQTLLTHTYHIYFRASLPLQHQAALPRARLTAHCSPVSSSAHHPLGGSVLSPSSASPIYLCGCLRRARVNHSCISRPSFSPPFSFSRRTSAAGKTSGMHDPNTPPRATNAALASGSPVIQLSRRDFDIMR
ncbi:hypothetical protein CF335_g7795, partial [Tilletia laevis]